MKNIVNLTPHTLNLITETGTREILPSGMIARAAQTREKIAEIDGIPINRTSFGEAQGLPAPQADTIYVVSALTAQAVPERGDVFITDDAVRDDQGRIIGCRALAHV